jgi:hypothetical protein
MFGKMVFQLDIVSCLGDSRDMSTDTKNSTVAAKAVPQEKDRFVEVAVDRTMYKPDTCKSTPLVGYLINKIPMPPIKGRNWSAFVIRTTAPVQTEDRDGNVNTVPEGSEVLIPATYALEQSISRAATAAVVFEVRITPTKKVDIGGGQSMWQYRVGADPTSGVPRNKFGFAAILGAAQEVPQLPPSEDDRLPF